VREVTASCILRDRRTEGPHPRLCKRRGISPPASVGCCRAALGRSGDSDLLPAPSRRIADRARSRSGAATHYAL